MCRWDPCRSPFAQSNPVSVRLAQRRFRFHARTFQAFETGSHDTKETRGAAAGNFRHLFLLLHATICHFTRQIRRLCAWMRRTPASLRKQNIRVSATNCRLYKLLTCEATYRSPAGVQLRQGGVNGYEEAAVDSSLHSSVGRRLKTVGWASEFPIRCV